MTLRALRAHAMSVLLVGSMAGCIRHPGVRMSATPNPVGDTLFVLSTPSYTVTTYRRDDMVGAGALNSAVRSYERLFGGAPPNILMLVDDGESPPAIDPPSARDTVRLPADHAPPVGDRRAYDRTRASAFLMACAWVSTTVERAAESTESDTAILIPTWFEVASAMLITFDGTEWSAKLEQARRVIGVRAVEELLSSSDRSLLPAGQATAMNVQSAALLEYFWERDPATLAGLPTRLGRGTPIQAALLFQTVTDLKAVNVGWQAWYLKNQHAGK